MVKITTTVNGTSDYSYEEVELLDGVREEQLEGRLATLAPRATETTGEYLSTALSLYFDHAERGMPRQGWSRFTELYRPGPGDSAPVAQCIEQVRTELRRKLNIPDSWQ